jgi:hypothetical protein
MNDGVVYAPQNTKAASYETADVMVPIKARKAPMEALCALSLISCTIPTMYHGP